MYVSKSYSNIAFDYLSRISKEEDDGSPTLTLQLKIIKQSKFILGDSYVFQSELEIVINFLK